MATIAVIGASGSLGRLTVQAVLDQGYTASSGDRLVREDLCTEAIRLGRLLAELMPGHSTAD